MKSQPSPSVHFVDVNLTTSSTDIVGPNNAHAASCRYVAIGDAHGIFAQTITFSLRRGSGNCGRRELGG